MKTYTVVMLWTQTDEVCVESASAQDALIAGNEALHVHDPEGHDLRVLAVFEGEHQDQWPGE